MTQKTLFATLMRSIYALPGCEGEFIADLTRPIPGHRSEATEGTLARIPATLHNRLTASIAWHVDSIEEAITFAMEDRDDYSEESLIEILTDLETVSPTVEYVRELRSDLRTLRVELARL